MFGRSGGARTPNPRFWRPVLYQLSYTPAAPSARLLNAASSPPMQGAKRAFFHTGDTSRISTQKHVKPGEKALAGSKSGGSGVFPSA